MHLPSQVHYGALLCLLPVGQVTAADNISSTVLPRPSGYDDAHKGYDNNAYVCKRVPQWVYKTPQVFAFCRWFHGNSGKPPVLPTAVTRTNTATVPKTATISSTATVTATTTATATATAFTTVTPTVTKTETSFTTTTGPGCQTPFARIMNKKRIVSPRHEAAPMGSLNFSQAEAETDLNGNIPSLLQDFGLPLHELHVLCYCVIDRPFTGPTPTTIETLTKTRTTTVSTTSTATKTITIPTTATVTNTVTGTTATETFTQVVPTCDACTPDGGPCDLPNPGACCSLTCTKPADSPAYCLGV